MSTLEIVLGAITTLLTCTNFYQVIQVKALRNKITAETDKLTAEADGMSDSVLYKRITFLDERITKLEELACFDIECPNRK